MSSLDLTRDWLQNVLKPYPSRERIIPEVLNILQAQRSLSVKTDAFTYDTGQTALLLLLHGTIPINYRGATYHIPVNLWIPHEYPRAPPLAFVVPTKEMAVRKGREVEPSGRVAEGVVAGWWVSWADKTINMLLKQLTSVFSAVPPVYARPPEPANGSSSSRQQAASPAGPSSSRQAGPAQPPPPPARPAFGPPSIQTESLPQYRSSPSPAPAQFSHARQASGQYTPSPASPLSNQAGTPHSPPIPARPQQFPPRQMSQPPGSPSGPQPPQRPYMPQQHPGQSYVQAYDPHQPPPVATPPRPAPVSQMGYQPPQSEFVPPMQAAAQQPYPANGYQPQQPYPPQQPQPSSQHPAQPSYTHSPPPQQTRPRSMVQDLMSSPEQTTSALPDTSDPNAPPPIPPSKPPPPSLLHLHSILLPHLNASLPPLVQSLHSNRQHLIDRKEDLSSGEPAIRDEMARLEAVKKVCDSVGRKMDDVVSSGAERVAELEQRGEISVDEVVCGISIVHNQLIDLVAEDNAIEDTIYHMTRALDAERIDLDRFLKSIRSLAREQYMKRALIERILGGMGQSW